jgi:hypothetical protein
VQEASHRAGIGHLRKDNSSKGRVRWKQWRQIRVGQCLSQEREAGCAIVGQKDRPFDGRTRHCKGAHGIWVERGKTFRNFVSGDSKRAHQIGGFDAPSSEARRAAV